MYDMHAQLIYLEKTLNNLIDSSSTDTTNPTPPPPKKKIIVYVVMKEDIVNNKPQSNNKQKISNIYCSMYICCVKMHLLFILLSLKIHKKQIILKRTIYLKKVFFCLSAGLISSIIVSEGELVASSVFSPPNRILQVCI